MATSFPSFPLLPKELRLAIWNLALEPRIVELCFEVADEEDAEKYGKEGGVQNEDLGNEEHAEEAEQDGQHEEPEIEQDSDFVVEKDGGSKYHRDEEGSHVRDDFRVETVTRDPDEDEGRKRNRRHEDVYLDIANPGREAGFEDADNSSETSEPTYSRALAPGQFYSPSPLPSLLRVNGEARSVALTAALKGFPVPANTEDVCYNPEIDILYFPAGCWQENIMGFEQAVSEEVKGSIRRIALENLVWMSSWEEGTANDQITIERFKNVKEFIFAVRNLTQCGCCINFDGPERGLVEFVDIDTNVDVKETDAATKENVDADSESEADFEASMDRVNDELRRKRERDALGMSVDVDEQALETKGKKEQTAEKFAYTKRYVDRLKVEFLKIKDSHPDWNVPEARIVRLKRGGIFAGDP